MPVIAPDRWRLHADKLREIATSYRLMAASPGHDRWRDQELAEAARLEGEALDALEWARREEEYDDDAA